MDSQQSPLAIGSWFFFTKERQLELLIQKFLETVLHENKIITCTCILTKICPSEGSNLNLLIVLNQAQYPFILLELLNSWSIQRIGIACTQPDMRKQSYLHYSLPFNFLISEARIFLTAHTINFLKIITHLIWSRLFSINIASYLILVN